ncbi:MAG TPA: AAA family ATPase [Actinobacteria bacterium]|nr:AAA family ATPase [Actinomycetota bacterium]
MFLKNINLRGFKSFGTRSSLVFEKGICIIVGPNGSGKSNIVDAISWVLGEQSPKSLRGSTMGDVIFKSKNEELAIAEVSLVFDNSDKVLPVEFTDVKFTRRVYLRGGSEYYINSSPARLSDVQDLISQSGIGKGLYTIINQGQINNVIMYKDIERKQIIDEIIGISKHKIRRDKSKSRLANVSEDIDRINDLIKEIKRTMDPLAIEAEKSKELSEIVSELREVELSLFLTNINNLNQQWDSENIKTEENLREIKEIQVKLDELNDSRIMFEDEHRSQKAVLSDFENRINNFKYYLNKLDSIQLLISNRRTSAETIANMIDFSIKNISGEKEDPADEEIAGRKDSPISYLKDLSGEIDKCSVLFDSIYKNLGILVKPEYYEDTYKKFSELNSILGKIKIMILNEPDLKKSGFKSLQENKSDSKINNIIEKTLKLNNVKKEVNRIINEINSFSKTLKKFFVFSEMLDEKINSEFENKKKEYNKKSAFYNNFDEKINMLNSRKNFLENDSYRADLKKEQIKEKVKDLTIKIFDDYNLSLDFILKNYKEAENPEISGKKLRDLKSRLQDYKNINPNAHLEYEKIKERFDFLNNQKEDLVESKKGLEKIINDLNTGIKKFFNEKFQEINENFKYYFKILFPTGDGELLIRDNDDYEEDEFGIDIKADTGSNKNISLQLLSGGEKALVSIAFLFSIFATNSSPFYVFDEIDSALDDANLDRFLTLAKTFSEDRQVIIISHQKKTMEIADIIYGFSMQSNGVTKIVSERLRAVNV